MAALREDAATGGGRLPGDRRRAHRRAVDTGERAIEVDAELFAELEPRSDSEGVAAAPPSLEQRA